MNCLSGSDDDGAGAEGRLQPGDRRVFDPPRGDRDEGAGRHADGAAGQGRPPEAQGAVVLPGAGHQGEREGEEEEFQSIIYST